MCTGGGSVSQTHMVVTGIGDDSFDGTDGYRGFIQFAIAQQRADDGRVRLPRDVLADLVGVDRANVSQVLRVLADGFAAVAHDDSPPAGCSPVGAVALSSFPSPASQSVRSADSIAASSSSSASATRSAALATASAPSNRD